ncbi:MAG: hypothetical protein IPP71_13310 [Bacteroidetes bacterium]|nr:hypothetical protein [Bacteroidota bacterium]
MKQDDDTLGTIVNGYSVPILQSENPAAGIPIKYKDGLIKKIKPPQVTHLGMDSLMANLYKLSTPGTGYEFSTVNGAWACLGGAEGPYPETNQVLIGQFTTNGVFYFEFNIQIGTPDGGVEQYVAKDPQGKELLNPDLKFDSAMDIRKKVRE